MSQEIPKAQRESASSQNMGLKFARPGNAFLSHIIYIPINKMHTTIAIPQAR